MYSIHVVQTFSEIRINVIAVAKTDENRVFSFENKKNPPGYGRYLSASVEIVREERRRK